MPVFISVNSIAIAPRGNVVMLFTMKGISTRSIYSELCLQCNAWQVVVRRKQNISTEGEIQKQSMLVNNLFLSLFLNVS